MKKFLTNLILLTTLATLCVWAAPVTWAATCEAINSTSQFTEGAPQPDPSLAGKLVVITEEPLGVADGKTTFRCARQIICTVKKQDGTSTKSPMVRKCTSKYVDANACKSDSPEEITNKLGMPLEVDDKYEVCEPVMVYVTDPGNSLLFFYIGQVYRYMATLGGIIAVLVLIIAGIMRATAGDSPDRVSKANALVYKSISGLVLLFLSAVILYTINPNFFVK